MHGQQGDLYFYCANHVSNFRYANSVKHKVEGTTHSVSQGADELTVTTAKIAFVPSDELQCISFNFVRHECGQQVANRELSVKIMAKTRPDHFV